MNRSVLLLVGGGCLLVGGLWIATLFAFGTNAWVVGLLLVAHGVAGLAVGGRQLLSR